MTNKVYNVGDMVWVASFGSQEVKVPCPVCYGNKEVTVILGNSDEVLVQCDYCGKGYEGPKGYITEYQYLAQAEQQTIKEIRVEKTRDSDKYEYIGEHRYYLHEEDMFDTEEEAYQRALEKAENYQQKQDNKIKYKNEKSYTWNAGYHMREAKSKQHDVEYHLEKAKLCKAKSRNKEE